MIRHPAKKCGLSFDDLEPSPFVPLLLFLLIASFLRLGNCHLAAFLPQHYIFHSVATTMNFR
jgi:hypothetical protein